MTATSPVETGGFTVRQAVFADLDKLVLMFDRYRQFYQRASDLDAARSFLTERFNHGESVLFIAEEGDKALGFTQLYPGFSSLSMARRFTLNDLFVEESARRRGVGHALLSAAADYGKSVGATALGLCTAKTNVKAQALYQSTGWVRDEVYLEYSLGLLG
jgi:GNAT superfamily N-acetyltransferase